MKLTLFILALQITSTQAILCWIFGLFAGGSSGEIEGLLDNQVANKPQATSVPGYDRFVIDDFKRPQFDGCSFSFSTDFRFYNSVAGPDGVGNEQGDATMVGTFDIWNFIFSFFQVCIDGLEVSELDLDNDFASATNAEDFARAYINSQFDDPECFEEED